ncbi:MAG: DUF3445 domain-containing protein [Paracoccaceae bacterium]
MKERRASASATTADVEAVDPATVLLAPAPYLPFLDPRQSRLPGIQPLDPAEWTVVHDDFAAQMRLRERLIEARADAVLATLPEGVAPAEELRAVLLDHLAGCPDYAAENGALVRPDGARVATSGPAMAAIGRMAAEDWCVLTPDPEAGEYRLVAAVLCFPSRWSLAEKLGRPLTAIHDPVPDYDATLARRVNRLFEGIRPGRPLWRANWLVHDDPTLFQPSAKGDAGDAAGHDGLYLRTERQTLARLPETEAVVFGIKTSVTPIEALGREARERLAALFAGLDEETIAFRHGRALHARLTARLAALAA